MPIVRINEDGTVRIARKSGKDPIDVKPEELVKYNPALLTDYNKIIAEQKTFTEEKSGKIDLTADEKKKESQKETLTRNLGILQKNLQEAELRGPVAGRLGFLSKLTGGAVAPEVADYESLRKGMIGQVARVISGETGVLTDQDIKRAENLLPKLSDSQKVAQNKLNNLRELLGREGESLQGQTNGQTNYGGILGGILGGATGMVGGPVGAGLGAAAGYAGGGALQNMLEDVTGRQQEQPIEQVKNVSSGAVGAGLTGYSAASLLNLLKGGAVKKLLNPRKAFSEARTAAAKSSGGKINTAKVIKAGEKYLESDPAASKYLETAKKAIESADSPTKILDRMKVWKSAYTSASKVGKSSKAGLYNELYQSALKELVEKAPEVAKYQKYLKLSYQVPKAIGKGAWNALKFSALGRLFGIGG